MSVATSVLRVSAWTCGKSIERMRRREVSRAEQERAADQRGS